MRPSRLRSLGCIALFGAAGCTVNQSTPDNTRGRATRYEDPSTPGAVQGIGIEAQDITSMTDQMMRDILAEPLIANREKPPRVIIDSEYFVNEGSSRINKNLLTDRLRVQLNRASKGRMAFVGRHQAAMVEKERQLKRDGAVTPGTTGSAAAPMGGDFRLGGRIATLDAVQGGTGTTSRYHQITFELIDLETSGIVWTNQYEFQKSGADDVIYR